MGSGDVERKDECMLGVKVEYPTFGIGAETGYREKAERMGGAS